MNGPDEFLRTRDCVCPHDFGYERVGRVGSHLKMRYESPDTDEVRVVTVPMASEDEIPTGTLHSIADQCGADDFHAWCEWIDEHR